MSVTRRDGAINYHPMPGAALVDFTPTAALYAMQGKMVAGTNVGQIALQVADEIQALSASGSTVDIAVDELRSGITGKAAAEFSLEVICAVFRLAMMNKIVNESTMPRGAFVVSVKVEGAWGYHVLASGVWAPTLPG